MEETTSNTAATELFELKAKADLIGVSYHPTIGLEKLKAKVDEMLKLREEAGSPSLEDEQKENAQAVTRSAPRPETEGEARVRVKREATKLILARVTCMNPAKKDWQGEIFTVSNSVLPTVKLFVPFNAELGWHIPNIVLNVMRDRMCQIFVSAIDERGNKIQKSKMIREFAIEILPPLTPEELKKLAARQAATGAIK